jgi:23S rRNA (cytidine1920-2'-O)/16S rRNA (cytidine1409-2'-O)-methyltransferase
MRLDRAVVDRGLARSRTHAQSLIVAGAIAVNGAVVTKASFSVGDIAHVSAVGHTDHYVSRAAHKLLGALDACEPHGLVIEGRTALDAGASTGGFTQVLLERGVASVIAADVGHGQISAAIAADPRVTVVEGMNVRDLNADMAGSGVELVVADLSFISLTVVIPALVSFAGPHADFLLMVKPQFEVGRERLGKGGVVTDPKDRADAVAGVVAAMLGEGLTIHHISRSQLPGPHGNVEFFVWGSRAWQARTVTGREKSRPALNSAAIKAAIDLEVER